MPQQRCRTAVVPLQVEGTISSNDTGSFEYTMVVVIRNERGEEVGRHVAGVGAVHPGEARSFNVTSGSGTGSRRQAPVEALETVQR